MVAYDSTIKKTHEFGTSLSVKSACPSSGVIFQPKCGKCKIRHWTVNAKMLSHDPELFALESFSIGLPRLCTKLTL